MGSVRLALAETLARRQLSRIAASPSHTRSRGSMAGGGSARNCCANADLRSRARHHSRYAELWFGRRLGSDARVHRRRNNLSSRRAPHGRYPVSVLVFALRATDRLERAVLQMER